MDLEIDTNIMFSSALYQVKGTLSVSRVFNPQDYGSVSLWLKADSLTLNDGDAIATWSDSSGNGKDATQATGSAQPLFKTGILNSQPVIRFDGVDDKLTSATFSLSQPNTIFVVGKATALGNTFFDGATSSQTLWRRAAGNWGFDCGATISAGAVNSSFHLFCAVANGASSILRLDGSQIASGDAGSNALTSLIVGSNSVGASAYLNGDIAEIIIYSGALNSTNRIAVETALQSKYGL